MAEPRIQYRIQTPEVEFWIALKKASNFSILFICDHHIPYFLTMTF